MSLVTAIIPAAGLGKRMSKGIPKALIKLEDKPIFIHTLDIITQHPKIEEVILVAPADYLDVFKKKIKDYCIKKIKAVISGGITRQESVSNALLYIDNRSKWVLIHDAVRPFINFKMISELISKVKKYKAVSLGMPINSTLKRVDKDGLVRETILRDYVWETQTPQIFEKELILQAHRIFKDELFSDDAGMVERLGVKVRMIRGSFFNIKITEPGDLMIAKAILRNKRGYGL
jgi:2-C-methyl-D-erythritol 4-phosphate cytidylyltransferase